MYRRGISPVIATVIIVAVAIAISIAVAGWLFGLWGNLAGGTPQVQVSTAVVYDNGTVALYLVNQGSGADTLLRAEVSNGSDTSTIGNWKEGTGSTAPAWDKTIEANFRGWVTGTLDNPLTLTPGQTVTLKLYFEKSGTVSIPVTVQAGQTAATP